MFVFVCVRESVCVCVQVYMYVCIHSTVAYVCMDVLWHVCIVFVLYHIPVVIAHINALRKFLLQSQN